MVSQNLFGGVTAELIKLRSGGITGAPGIQKALDDVKTMWVQEMIDQVDAKYTPQNIPYRTGAMYNHFKDRLHNYTPGQLHIGAPWSRYAGFVDAMEPPVEWTGGGNRYHWFQKVLRFVENIKVAVLRVVIRRVGLASTAGQTVGQLTERMRPE